jgi:hypothetical protein
LEEITLLEETDDHLKFKITELKLSKLITFISVQGQVEEFHLVELELLLFLLNKLNSSNNQLNEFIVKINNYMSKQLFLDFSWDYKKFYHKLSGLNEIIDQDLMINGEFLSYKGSFHSDFDLELKK